MESVLSFSELGLAEPILRAVSAAGYETPTPIQAQAIPLVISGCDLLGVAQTGTGKTAAFALPILHRLLQASSTRPAQG
ncbi:MAG: DEAD/DEAH box helicase, partial [Planctomycetaceae bacterium]|nr:DEAD/DEAH box helicase [Planctomycetaceae bacterium]